jgi:ribosomal protein S27E
MNVLKFECPGCGQHLECDSSLGGDVIHCPRCCAELRIPFGGSADIPGTIKRAEMILHAPAAAPPSPQGSQPPAQPAPAALEPMEVLCPVCQSQLRVRAEVSKPGSVPPVAELARKGELKDQPAQTSGKPEENHPDLDHMTLEERERQIAAAREAHPIQLNPPVKPRLSYILSGEAPLPGKETPDKHEPSRRPFGSEPPNTFTE